MEANKSYGWTFTPTDTANYKPLTGTIKLWSKSTSSGGYYYAPTAASGTRYAYAVQRLHWRRCQDAAG